MYHLMKSMALVAVVAFLMQSYEVSAYPTEDATSIYLEVMREYASEMYCYGPSVCDVRIEVKAAYSSQGEFIYRFTTIFVNGEQVELRME